MIVKSKKTYGRGTRFTAFAVAFVFTVTSVIWITPATAAPTEAVAPAVLPMDTFSIPPEMGSIQKIFRRNHAAGLKTTKNFNESLATDPEPQHERFVVLIQDAHAVVDAQENIAKILDHVQKSYGIRLTALEGAKSKLDPTLFRTFPDMNIKKKVLSGYLKRGEITGVQMASIFSEKENGYYGIEDWKLYEENYRAYLRAQEGREVLEAKWKAFKTHLDESRKTVYSEKMNEFQDRWEDFRAERTSLAELLMYLVNFKKILAQDQGLPELNKLVDSVGYTASGAQEKLVPVIKTMAAEFKAKYVRGMDVKSEMNFYNRYQAFLTGQMESGQFLQYMIELGHERGFRPKLTPSIRRLLGHTETLSAIKGSELFAELQKAQETIEASLMTKPAEKEIAVKYRRLFLLQELLSLELTHETLSQYQTDPEAYLDLLGDAAFKEGLASAVEFYKLALERDLAFFKNLTARMEEQKQSMALVVAGGFHTNGLQRILEEQQISYAVVSPRMASLAGWENYAKVMRDDVSYKEFLKTTYYDAFVRDATERFVKEMNQPDFVRNLKAWRDDVIRDLSRQGRIAKAGDYTRYLDALAQVYVSKFGKGPVRSKEEILKILSKELNDFRDKNLGQLWQHFESQLGQFIVGLKGLGKRSELNPQNVSALLNGPGDAQPSALNSPDVLDPTLTIISVPPSRSETRTEAVDEGEAKSGVSEPLDPLDREGKKWLKNFRKELSRMAAQENMRLGGRPGDVLYPNADAAYLMALRGILPVVKPGSRVLEMGVGSGVFLGMLAEFLRRRGIRADFVGIDTNENAAKLSRRMLQPLGNNMQIFQGNLFGPVIGERFDEIFFNAPWFRELLPEKEQGIQMVDKDGTVLRFLNEAPDHLSPSGRLHLLFPVELFKEIESQLSFSFNLKASYRNGNNLEIGLFEYDSIASRRSRLSETPKQKRSFFSAVRDLEEEGLRRIPAYFRSAAKRELALEIAGAVSGPSGVTGRALRSQMTRRSEVRDLIPPEEEAEEARLKEVADKMESEGFRFGNEFGKAGGNTSGLTYDEAKDRIINALMWAFQMTGFRPEDAAMLRAIIASMNEVLFAVGMKTGGDTNRISISNETQALYQRIKGLPVQGRTEILAEVAKFQKEQAVPEGEPQPLEEGFKKKVPEIFNGWDSLPPLAKLEVKGVRYVDLGCSVIQAQLKGVAVISQEPERVLTRYTDPQLLREASKRYKETVETEKMFQIRTMIAWKNGKVGIVFVKQKKDGTGFLIEPFLLDSIDLEHLSAVLADRRCPPEITEEIERKAWDSYEIVKLSHGDDLPSNFMITAFMGPEGVRVEIQPIDFGEIGRDRSEVREGQPSIFSPGQVIVSREPPQSENALLEQTDQNERLSRNLADALNRLYWTPLKDLPLLEEQRELILKNTDRGASLKDIRVSVARSVDMAASRYDKGVLSIELRSAEGESAGLDFLMKPAAYALAQPGRRFSWIDLNTGGAIDENLANAPSKLLMDAMITESAASENQQAAFSAIANARIDEFLQRFAYVSKAGSDYQEARRITYVIIDDVNRYGSGLPIRLEYTEGGIDKVLERTFDSMDRDLDFQPTITFDNLTQMKFDKEHLLRSMKFQAPAAPAGETRRSEARDQKSVRAVKRSASNAGRALLEGFQDYPPAYGMERDAWIERHLVPSTALDKQLGHAPDSNDFFRASEERMKKNERPSTQDILEAGDLGLQAVGVLVHEYGKKIRAGDTDVKELATVLEQFAPLANDYGATVKLAAYLKEHSVISEETVPGLAEALRTVEVTGLRTVLSLWFLKDEFLLDEFLTKMNVLLLQVAKVPGQEQVAQTWFQRFYWINAMRNLSQARAQAFARSRDKTSSVMSYAEKALWRGIFIDLYNWVRSDELRKLPLGNGGEAAANAVWYQVLRMLELVQHGTLDMLGDNKTLAEKIGRAEVPMDGKFLQIQPVMHVPSTLRILKLLRDSGDKLTDGERYFLDRLAKQYFVETYGDDLAHFYALTAGLIQLVSRYDAGTYEKFLTGDLPEARMAQQILGQLSNGRTTHEMRHLADALAVFKNFRLPVRPEDQEVFNEVEAKREVLWDLIKAMTHALDSYALFTDAPVSKFSLDELVKMLKNTEEVNKELMRFLQEYGAQDHRLMDWMKQSVEKTGQEAWFLGYSIRAWMKGGSTRGNIFSEELEDVLRQLSEDHPRVVSEIDKEFQTQGSDILKYDLFLLLKNLIVNALDKTVGAKTVKVKADRLEQDGKMWVKFTVADDGGGMSAEQLEMRRNRVAGFSTKEQGLGVGLLGVWEVVDRYKGTMTIDSEIGKGTTFTIMLPLILETPPTHEAKDSEESQRSEVREQQPGRTIAGENLYATPQIMSMIVKGQLDGKEVFIFDYDGTLAADKESMLPEMAEKLLALIVAGKKVIILSNGNFQRLKGHLEGSLDSRGVKFTDRLTGGLKIRLYAASGGEAYDVSSDGYQRLADESEPFENAKTIENLLSLLASIRKKFPEILETQLLSWDSMVAVKFRLLNPAMIPQIKEYLEQQKKAAGISLSDESGPIIDSKPFVGDLNGRSGVDSLYHAWFISSDKARTITKRVLPVFCKGDVSKAVFVGDGFGPGGSDEGTKKVAGLTKASVISHQETQDILGAVASRLQALSGRSEARVGNQSGFRIGELAVEVNPSEIAKIAEKATMVGGIEDVRLELREKGQAKLGEIRAKYDQGRDSFLREIGQQSDIVGFIVSPECAAHLKGRDQFGGLVQIIDIQELYERMMSAAVMQSASTEFANARRPEVRKVDMGEIQRFAKIILDQANKMPGSGVPLIVKQGPDSGLMLDALRKMGKISKLIILYDKDHPVGRGWNDVANVVIKLRTNERKSANALVGDVIKGSEGESLMAFLPEETHVDQPALLKILENFQGADNPELKRLACAAVILINRIFASAPAMDQDLMKVNPGMLISKLKEKGIDLELQTKNGFLVMDMEMLALQFSAQKSFEKAA